MQIAEIDATNEDAPHVAKTYLWNPSEPVATRVLHMNVWNNGREMESLYYTHDLQKNVTALFGQAASRRAQYEYDPYGNPINTTGDAAGLNPYRYSSEYHDEDLGLIYYNYRHYNPTDGRWINRDPIAEQGGINLYGFVDNNSLEYIDNIGNRKVSGHRAEIMEYMKEGNYRKDQFSWDYSFNIDVKSKRPPQCGTITISVVIDLVGRNSDQEKLFEDIIKNRWSNTHKVMCENGCCYNILIDITWQRWWRFAANTDYKVNLHSKEFPINMTLWSTHPNSVEVVAHEFGHMLGLLDKYLTINGILWGKQNTRPGVMNTAKGSTIPEDYATILTAAKPDISTACGECKVTKK